MTPRLIMRTLVAVAVLVGARGTARAQEPSADDAVDTLLKKLDDGPKKAGRDAGDDKKEVAPRDKVKPRLKGLLKAADDLKKGDPDAAKGSADKAKGAADKAKGEVAPGDASLDDLLKNLGDTPDKPAPEEPKSRPGKPGGEQKPGDPAAREEGVKDPREKEIDARLEQLIGRRRKQKDGQGGEGQGPLSKVIKEMDDVESRLAKRDSGEETREKQGGIVKQIDGMIERMRQMSSESKSKKPRKGDPKPGKPGDQPGQEPGTQGGYAPLQKPKMPDGKHSMAGGKDEWGHLPPELRMEMDNVFKEEALPSKQDLIRRYYLTISKKSLAQED